MVDSEELSHEMQASHFTHRETRMIYLRNDIYNEIDLCI